LVSVFSPPDQDILKLSHNAAYICYRSEPEALSVVDVKTINAVVAMVPDFQVTPDGNLIAPKDRFSLMESPFLKFAALSGTLDGDDDAIDDTTDNVE
jgi:hypothetical protein